MKLVMHALFVMINNFQSETYSGRPFGLNAMATTRPKALKSASLSHMYQVTVKIWCEIHSKKAKDGSDIHFKVKYIHIAGV